MGIKALLMAAALAGCLYAAQSPTAADYDATCEVSGTRLVKGFVKNNGPDVYQVNGGVKFEFPQGVVQTVGNAVIPAGQTVFVAAASLPFDVTKDETCRFDVDDSIRKVGSPGSR